MQIQVNTKTYLNLTALPESVAASLDIQVSNHAYLPKTDDLSSDWVAYIAVPAFKLIRRQYGKPVESFCSIGTGSGLDVLSAIELLGSTRVGFTDLLKEVVDTAAENVARNVLSGKKVVFEHGAGDLLAPLAGYSPRYEVIYENLPNVPLTDGTKIEDSRNSGPYLEKRKEAIPELVHNQMLDLHYLALRQAVDFLTPTGSVYSTLGGRVGLDVFIELGRLAGFRSEIFTYTWKVQAEPEDVITGYAAQEAAGLGPFHFYYAKDLREAFAGISAEESGKRAFELEKSLKAKELSAAEALKAWKAGAEIGHTAIVLKSTPA